MNIELKELPDWLQENHYDKLMFGLGFIQVKVDEHTRYHFYHPELESIMDEEEAHDHRYGFKSEILKGCLRQEIYNVRVLPGAFFIDEYEWNAQAVSCDPDNPVPSNHTYYFATGCQVQSSIIIESAAGSQYEIYKDTFHKVLPTREPTVTRVTREVPSKEFARALRKYGAKEVCPFEPNMKEEELWEWVRRIVQR